MAGTSKEYGSNLALSTVEDLKSLSLSRIIFNKTTFILETGFSLRTEITDHEAKNCCVVAKADRAEPFFANNQHVGVLGALTLLLIGSAVIQVWRTDKKRKTESFVIFWSVI